MQTIGQSQRLYSEPAPSLLESLSWVEKLPVAVLAGVLLGFSSAAYGIWWLAWFCVAPLLLLVFSAKTKAESVLYGIVFGLAYHLVALRWFFDLSPMRWLSLNDSLSPLVALQLWFLESLHQSLLVGLFALFLFILPMRTGFIPHFKRPFFPMYLTIPLLWVFLQWCVGTAPLFLAVPIDQLAYGQTRCPALIQIAQLGGAPLVDFLLLLINCVAASFLIEIANISPHLGSRMDLLSNKMGAVFDVGFIAALMAVILQWGSGEVAQAAALPRYWQDSGLTTADGGAAVGRTAAAAAFLTAEQKSNYAPPVPIAIVQGGVTIDERQKLTGADIAQRYLPLMKNLGVGLIVLPADVMGGANRGTEPLRSALPRLAADEKKDVIAGSSETTSSGLAESVRLYSPGSARSETYVQFRLIPFVDYTPLGPLGSLMSEGLSPRLVGNEPHVTSRYITTIQSTWGRVGASVGAEFLYPDLIATEVNRGASLLVNLCDLSCFHKSGLGEELLAVATMRAVENGRYFVLASGSGVSAVIDPHGIVTSSSMMGQKGVLLDRVQFLHRRTPFARLCLGAPLYR